MSAEPVSLADVPNLPPHLSVPEAGRIAFGLGRSESYAAAADGRLRTIEASEHRKVVPTAEVLRILGLPLPGAVTDATSDGLAPLLARALRAAADVLEEGER